MSEHAPPEPVKVIVAALYADRERLAAAERLLVDSFGEVDFRGGPHPFDVTDYYAPEMGGGLQRVLLAFGPLQPPEDLPDWKWRAHEAEQALAAGGRRTVNLDVGYLDRFKLVLASFKGRGNKVYLGQAVWADMTLTYARGAFHPLPWSFPDFRDGRYDADLLAIRSRYSEQLRERGGQSPGDDGQ